MSVATDTGAESHSDPSMVDRGVDRVAETVEDVKEGVRAGPALNRENARRVGQEMLYDEADEMDQMGAKRIGSLAIGIGVVGIVLNQMSNMDVVTNSTGVVDVQSIFDTAGSGLQLLVVGVIIAAAAVLLNLWSGF